MPSRNVVKVDVEQSYYHVYARGINKQVIFTDSQDYAVFLNLLKRYLAPEPTRDKHGREYRHLRGQLELLCFCVLPNHFHFLVYQHEAGNLQAFMRGVMTSYSNYFNKQHNRSGSLFETTYKASRISNETYLMHISRYIHLNATDWQTWEWSSLGAYTGRRTFDWLQPEKILELFSSPTAYVEFVADYEEQKQELDRIKDELAD